MSKLFCYFVELTRLKANPSDVPYSWPLLAVLVVINVIIELSSSVTDWPLPITTIIAMSIGSRILILLMFYALLYLKSVKERWLQMSAAWLGVAAILGSLRLIIALLSLMFDVSQLSAFAFTLFIAELTLLFWLIRATAYVLHLSLDISKLVAITLTVFILFASASAKLHIAHQLSPTKMATIEAKVIQMLESAQSNSSNLTHTPSVIE